jgi:hypothetical protein
MGEVISKNAATADIIDHGRQTITKADAREGRVRELTHQRLDDVLGAATLIEGRVADTKAALVPLTAAVEKEDKSADNTTGRISDEIWNALGRPANDIFYSLLFPGGIGLYTGSAVDEEPEMLGLLAELITLPLSPKLNAEQKARWQAELTAAAAPLRAAVEARAPLVIRLNFHTRVLQAVAKLTQMRLAMLKRDLKNEGLTEQQIHEVIPDAARARPRPAPAPAPAPTA